MLKMLNHSFSLTVQNINLNIDTAEKEQKAYNALMTWLNTEAQEVLSTAQDPIEDRESEFLVWMCFLVAAAISTFAIVEFDLMHYFFIFISQHTGISNKRNYYESDSNLQLQMHCQGIWAPGFKIKHTYAEIVYMYFCIILSVSFSL